METDFPLEERIVQVFQHLGIARAHVAASITGDWRGLARRHSDLVASLTLVFPAPLDPTDVSALAARLLVVTADRGPDPERLRRSLSGLPDVALITLHDYLGETWADVIADRTHEIRGPMLEFLQRVDQQATTKALALAEEEGEIAGVSYRIRGTGPPLALFPLALAPSQWDPLLPALAARYCTISLGGAALGTVALLETRGRLGYLGTVRSLMDAIQVRPGEVVVRHCAPRLHAVDRGQVVHRLREAGPRGSLLRKRNCERCPLDVEIAHRAIVRRPHHANRPVRQNGDIVR